MIYLSCPGCGVRLKLQEDRVGHQGKCPKCKTDIIAGEAPAQQPTPESTPTSAEPQGNRYGAWMILGGLVVLLMATSAFYWVSTTSVQPKRVVISLPQPIAAAPVKQAPIEPPASIPVSFTNETKGTVSFSLNGGSGLSTRLAPGQSIDLKMVVDPGVQPIVGITQADGSKLNFKVHKDGRYWFRMPADKIKLFDATTPGIAQSAKVKGLNESWAVLSEATTSYYYRGNVRSDLPQFIAISRLPELERNADPSQRIAIQEAMKILGKKATAETERDKLAISPKKERERLNDSIIEGFRDPNNADNAYYKHLAKTARSVNEWATADFAAKEVIAKLQDHWRAKVLPSVIAAAGPETDKPLIEVYTEKIFMTIWFWAKNISGQKLTNCTLIFVVDEGFVRGALRGCDIKLMNSLKDVSEIPTEGKKLIIVAAVDQTLHIRIFNPNAA